MKRILALAVLGTAFVFRAQSALADDVETARFASNTTWHVFTGVPPAGPLGHAQTVCLNAAAPANCPAGATLYGHPGGGWSANLSSIPHALWIWAPGIDGTTHPAELAQYFFTKRIRIHGHPISGRISVAVDDFAEVRVNGTIVGATGSTTSPAIAQNAANSLTTFNIGSYLHHGRNRITIRAQNGEGSFAGCTDCTYQLHPAGVVFGVKIRFRDDDD